jgi:hypothetical protein
MAPPAGKVHRCRREHSASAGERPSGQPPARRAAAQRWGGPVPKDLRLVTPASLAEDSRLAVVAGRR